MIIDQTIRPPRCNGPHWVPVMNALMIGLVGLCGAVAALLVISICSLLRKRRLRRSLALAFVGEISALVHEFDISQVTEKLELALATEMAQSIELTNFVLPRFVAYETNANRLNLLGSSLPRQLSHFYTRLALLAGRIRTIASRLSPESDGSRKPAVQLVLSEVKDEMDLADEILRALRILVSAARPASISRA